MWRRWVRRIYSSKFATCIDIDNLTVLDEEGKEIVLTYNGVSLPFGENWVYSTRIHWDATDLIIDEIEILFGT